MEDVESWKPRLIVAYLPDWAPEVSELALEVVRRQRAEERNLLLTYPIHTTVPLPLGHVWRIGGSRPLNERHDSGGLRQRAPWLPD